MYTYVLVGTPWEERPLGRPTRRWEDNIKMYLRETWCKDMNCTEVNQDRAFLNMVIVIRFPSKQGIVFD
jgi:hypothetical protein